MENNQETPTNEEQQDLLSEEAYINNHFEYATQGQRFLNWLIDNLLMRFGLSYLSGIVIGALLGAIAPDFLSKIVYSAGANKKHNFSTKS